MSSNAKPAGQGAAATKKATALGGLFTLGPKPAALEEEGEEEGEEDAEGAFRHQPPTNSTGGHAWIKQDIKGTMPAKMKKAMKVKNTIRFDDEGKAHTHQEPSSWADDEYGSDAPYGGKRRGGKRGGGKGRPSKYDDYGYDGYGYDGYDPYGKRGYYDDLDQDYYWDPKNNGQGSVLRKKEARNVYNFLTSSEQYYAGQTVAYGATPRGQAPVTFTYTNELRCGAFGANARVGSCFAVATFDPTTLNGQITITCTLHEDASNLCGMKYVAGMRIAAQGPLKVTNPLSDTPNLKADMIPITGIYMPNRRTTLLADVATLLSGVKGGALMFDTNVLGDDGKFTFYFWR